ncbi:hypothetical protein [Dysgonomonas sp. 511]|uniref:hypothetical protein n=1 Tax=Dysgonomonas sp. 511 TaxID=2302930 RepID=UPI0013D69B43|nr:hypothetical protein [Dysgonomonas sp. 511]NDV80330.1 hypothetical protein [Dysgonomonas sp. 511]
MDAYFKGLNDADGWEKVMSLDPVFTQTPDCGQCSHWSGFFSDKEGDVYCPNCGKLLNEPLYETVELNGHEFNIRVLNVKGPLNGKMISTDNLNDMLLGDDNDYISEDARQLDEMIKFYVPASKISLPDEQLAEYINLNLKSLLSTKKKWTIKN